MAATFGIPVIFGTQKKLPLRGFPKGKIRLRIRKDDFMLARVRTLDGIREFAVIEKDGFWTPAFETNRNLSVESK